jgi:glyoxylase-like metal-dependent hydrolase (beta-lactamase superfamily II)
VPGRVYVLSGFEFTEYYFVVSDDRQELIGIDAGTRPDSAQTAYDAPNLPELTTVLITHSHWDHVGGHKYFRGLSPRLQFYARDTRQPNGALELSLFSSRFFSNALPVQLDGQHRIYARERLRLR